METQPQTGERLAVLIIGHDDTEASRWVHELKKNGYTTSYRRLESADAFRSALQLQTWDIILSEYALARFGAMDVLNILSELKLEIPVIAIADPTQPDIAAQIIKAGAHDFLLKKNIHLLTETVRRAREKTVFDRAKNTGRSQIHAQEERFRKLADQAPVMLWMADTEGNCTFVNQRWIEFTGLPLSQCMGHSWIQVIHPEDLPRCLNAYRHSEQHREEFTLEYRMRRADNEYRWVLDTGVPQFDREGRFNGFIGSSIDITDRTQWEEGLRLRDKLLDAVARSTIMLLSSDDFTGNINQTLSILGEAIEVDRAHIFENHVHPQTGAILTSQRAEWVREGVSAQVNNPDLQNVSYEPDFAHVYSNLAAGKTYKGFVKNMSAAERRILEPQSIQSLLLVPIQVKNRLWGFIDFDDCHHERIWSANDESLLYAMAGSIGAAIARQQAEELLHARDKLLQGVAKATHELLTTASFAEGIQNVLKTLGAAAGIERVYIFENRIDQNSGAKTALARFAWSHNGHGKALDTTALNKLSDSTLFPRWYDILESGRPISGRVLDFLPTEAEHERKLRSILLVPIMIEHQFWGFLGFDDGSVDRVWLPGDESILTAMAGSIGAAIVRKRTEEALRHSEEHFRSLIENATDIITILDRSGKILYGSPAIERSLGYNPQAMIGMTVFNLLHPDDAGTIKRHVEQLLANSESVRSAEFRIKHIDGTWHFFEGIGKRLPDEQNVMRFVINARDITKRKTAENALRQSEELLRHSQKMEAVGRLAGGVAHDFNNLLTAIIGYSELILNRLQSYDPVYHEVEEICKAAERAHSLTRQLLAFSRKQVLEPKSTNLNNIVVEMEKLLRRLIGEDIELVTQLQSDLGIVKIDPGQMEQVIVNLAVNARDAMPGGGKLMISTDNKKITQALSQGHTTLNPGSYVALSISDTGHGMNDYVKAHLFEPFFTTKEVGKGTGLGLSMVYGIVEQSGGHIVFDSEPGHGTTWTIYLPRLTETNAGPGKKTPAKMPRGTETILLVEDEAIVRDLARRILSDQGYTILSAINGKEAIDLCPRYNNPIHLLLTDIVMPQMSGHALARQLQAIYPNLKVLYMSGYAEETFRGVDAPLDPKTFIQKPFTPSSLAQKVREMLDR